jgi:hypothetical protein
VVAVVLYKRGCVRWHGTSASNSSYSDVAGSTAAPPWNTSVALESGPQVDSDASTDRAFSSDRQMGISLTVFEAVPPAPPQAEDADIPDDPNLSMLEDQFDAEGGDTGGLHYSPSAVVTWKEFNGTVV